MLYQQVPKSQAPDNLRKVEITTKSGKSQNVAKSQAVEEKCLVSIPVGFGSDSLNYLDQYIELWRLQTLPE